VTIRVLVVDDSAFVRKVVSQMLSRSPGIEVVGIARDGADALEQVERHRPDVVTLDLTMPGMSGIEFIREQMRRRPVAMVVCSIAHHSGAAALEALEAGAVDFVQKPTALATDRIFEISDELLEKVKAAASVRLEGSDGHPGTVAVQPSAPAPRAPSQRQRPELIVIGISTGGPQALREVIPRLPADFPVPVAIVLHMPVGYTRMYAQRLNESSLLNVREAEEGEPVQAGVVFIARAGKHLTFRQQEGGGVCTHLTMQPMSTPHRPSVDVLFQSAADIYADRVLAIVMTGMGSDGLLGAAHIKAKGGMVLTEAESSCVVYGMPRAVVEASVSDGSVPLSEMASSIRELVNG
jgi:two-component system, chemotaxis family, protein-glutamate methylesterase/glutaminase